MSKRKNVLVPANAQHCVALGIILTAAGSWLLWEGYERRGRSRPWGLRLLPGP